MPIRPSDRVQFVGPGPRPTPESAHRHDPHGDPRPGDYGAVLDVAGESAIVAWDFGTTSLVSIDHLGKWHARTRAHRYSVLFESSFQRNDITFTVVTEGGEAKAVWMASSALARRHPDVRPWAVEVEDLGIPSEPDPTDLISYEELA